MEQSTLSILILAAVLILFIWQKIPVSVVAMMGALAMTVVGILKPEDAFAAFGGDTVLLVLFMMILGEAVFQSGLARLVGRLVSKHGNSSEKKLVIFIVIITAVLSAFLSNTATVAMLMALIGSLSATGVISLPNKKAFMALGIASTIGGLGTLVGSVVQVPVNNVLRDTTGMALGFFSLLPIWAVLVFVMIVYYFAAGCRIQDRIFRNDSDADSFVPADIQAPEENRLKMAVTAATMLFCIVCFATNLMPLYIMAAVGTCICILTGCISEKRAFECVNWSVLITLASLIAIAKGIGSSGAGDMIANGVLGAVGTNSPWIVFAVVVALCSVLTNFMNNPAVAVLVIPIALNMAQAVGMNPLTMAVGVIVGATLAIATPVGSPPIAMTMVAGYKFTDYVRLGTPLLLLCYVATVIAVPLIYGM